MRNISSGIFTTTLSTNSSAARLHTVKSASSRLHAMIINGTSFLNHDLVNFLEVIFLTSILRCLSDRGIIPHRS